MSDGQTLFNKMWFRKVLHCFVIITWGFASISSVNFGSSRCPPNYERLHDRLCYKISPTAVLWTAANRACNRDKGSLITMKSAVDVDNLRQIMSRSRQLKGTAFIGIIDRGDGAGYANLDETNIPNPFWEDHTTPVPQQFSDPRCGYVVFPSNGEWKSGACGARRKYICSYVPMNVRQRTAAKKQIRCHVCNGATSNERCNRKGTVLCPPNAGSCQNEVRVVNGRKTITKRCKQTRACRNNFLQNSKAMWLEAQCKPGRKGSSVCRCCCQGNACNAEELPCLAKGCEPIRVPKDGRIKCTDEYMVGSLCTFSCDFGFGIVGSRATRCTGEGGWSSPAPQCLRTECLPIMTAPGNGSVTCTDSNFGASTCRFKCDYGYYLRGLPITTCLGTSKWSVARPACHLITCDRPLKAPSNGRIVDQNPGLFGEATTFECDEKYFLVGNPRVRCTDRNLDGVGDWTSKEPTCRLIKCSPALKQPLNGKLNATTRNNEIGTLATFSCNEGYFLVGNPTITCEGSTKDGFGKWSGKEPKCEVIQCPKVKAPLNGEEIHSTTATPRYGTIITFSCKFGYFRNGAESSRCVDEDEDEKGEWSNKPPTCEEIICFPRLKAPANGRLVRDGGTALSSSSDFSCDQGYFLLGSSRITCQVENEDVGVGKWSSALPTCKQIVCPQLTAPSNGKMICTDDNGFGTSCQFSCDSGFFMSGSKSSLCADDNGDGDGEWRNRIPECVPIECPWPINAPDHGSVSCSEENLHGSECEFKCEEGYWLKESDLVVCEGDGSSKDGKWSRNPPICFEINCDRLLAPPEFGSVSCNNEQNFGSICAFTCNTGYHLDGISESVCGDANNDGKGEWSGKRPQCKESTCRPAIGAIEFGKSSCTNDNGYGSVCEFQCDPGYKLSGEATVSCGEPRNGVRATWSSSRPICEVLQCSEPENPEGGNVVCSNGAVFGSSCTFSCNADRYLNGNARKTCIAENSNPGAGVVWSDTYPICQKITCNKLESTSDQLTIECNNSQLDLGTVCAFECKEGYSLIGEGETKCAGPTSRDVGTWTNPLPSCRRIKCDPEALSPTNGTVECTDENFYGSVCTYQCSDGYSLMGESTRRCQEDSAWDNLEPDCERMTCQPPIYPPENGISTCSDENYVGSICQSFCNLGYDMNGRVDSRCVLEDDGVARFTNPSPTCTPIYCDDIAGPIEGGNILCGVGQGNVESNRYDTTCFLSCNNGWRALGSTRTTCLGFGEWEGGIGRCEKIICQPPLGKPPRGDVACNNRENIPGTVCTFKCNPGLQLDRNGVITCQDSGQWSGEPPACVSG